MLCGVNTLPYRAEIVSGCRKVKEPMHVLCCMIVYCILHRLYIARDYHLVKKSGQISSDYFYRIYARHYPPAIGRFKEIIPILIPAYPSKKERKLRDGKSYFGNRLPRSYAESKAVMENVIDLGARHGESECVAYTRIHLHEYEDPEYRKMMARSYFEDSLSGEIDRINRRREYFFTVANLCEEEINDLYWSEFEDKEKADLKKTFTGLASTVTGGNQEARERFLEEIEMFLGDPVPPEWKETWVHGRPAQIFNQLTFKERLQTDAEHRQEWDEMSLEQKLDKIFFNRLSKVQVYAVVGAATTAVVAVECLIGKKIWNYIK